jgi:hypothetical protein
VLAPPTDRANDSLHYAWLSFFIYLVYNDIIHLIKQFGGNNLKQKSSQIPSPFITYIQSILPQITKTELLEMIKQMDNESQKKKIDNSIRGLFEKYADYVNRIFQVLQKSDIEILKQKNELFLELDALQPITRNSLIKSSHFSFPETYKDYVLVWFPFLEEDNDLLKQNSISNETSYLKELLIMSHLEYYNGYLLYKKQLENLENYFNELIASKRN